MKDITPAMRPQMSDFAPAEPAAPAPAAVQSMDSATGLVDPATGKIADGAPQGDEDPAEGPSAADAWQFGHEARSAGKALRAVPPEWRTPEFQTFADAWADGWRARDEEMAAEKK
jgi:hypothetical protein